MKNLYALAVYFGLVAAPVAQEREPDAGLVAVHQAWLAAQTTGVVLNIAAHPDDESSRTNAILRRKFGWRVITLYSTYGDGGQNAIGREIGPELARLRVLETNRAAAMSDVEVLWLGMPDFGFSKTLDETLQVWGGARLKDRMRSVLDALEPDLVITNHSLTQGHGHHRASYWAIAELLQERAVAGRRVPPLYARCTVEEAELTLDPAELEPARGETYARLAHRAWTQHVTQGPWGPHNPLQVGKDWWKLANPGTATLPAAGASLPTSDPHRWLQDRDAVLRPLTAPLWGPDRAVLQQAIKAQLAAVRRRHEAAILEPTAALLAALRYRADLLQRLWLALAGVRIEAWLERDVVALGGQGKAFVVVHGVDRLRGLKVRCGEVEAEPAEVPVRATMFDGLPAPIPGSGEGAGEPAVKPATQAVPGRLQIEFSPEEQAGGVPPSGPELAVVRLRLEAMMDEVAIDLELPLAYTPVPAIEVAWDREVLVVPAGRKVERLLGATVTSHRDRPSSGPIRLSMGPGILAVPLPSRLELTPEHPQARLLVKVTVDADELVADAGLELGFRDQATRIRVQPIEVVVPPGLRVALVRGPDDSTERALADLGIGFVTLDRDALAMARLEEFTTVLLDIRAYYHRPELAELRDRLLQFVGAGGRVVAMYHKPGEWNERAARPQLAPFPLTVGSDRITEEDAAVVLLQPQHRLMTHPHSIGGADFEGWVQERGLNFPSKWDVAWIPLLEMKDSGDEKPLQGALLYTQYGRGDFVYCSLALYRQLRVGNAGAIRLLLNLLAK
jgi:LmbE family N-acetylglucosaminyl deacetylase